MHAGFGKEPVFIGTGGSIGPVATFDRVLKLPQIMIGVGLPDDAIHAPNEKFALDNYYQGIDATIRFWQHVGAMASGSAR